MTREQILQKLSEQETLALTMWGEARREPLIGLIAVGRTVMNRLEKRQSRFGRSAKDICLKPWQYSCWIAEGGVSNFNAVMSEARRLADGIEPTDPKLRSCLWLAGGLLAGLVEDVVYSATHYYAPKAMKPPTKIPVWAHPPAVLTVVIANHRFYKGA